MIDFVFTYFCVINFVFFLKKLIDFVFTYYFVIDPNKFLNCGLLSSSFRVFSFQLFVPSRTKVNIENSEDGINILTSESTKLNIKERNQLFRPAFQERGKEGESPRGHFIPALDKFDPARAQKNTFLRNIWTAAQPSLVLQFHLDSACLWRCSR